MRVLMTEVYKCLEHIIQEVVSRKCCVKSMFLKISLNSHANTCARVSFLKFLRTPFFIEHLYRSPCKQKEIIYNIKDKTVYYIYQKVERTYTELLAYIWSRLPDIRKKGLLQFKSLIISNKWSGNLCTFIICSIRRFLAVIIPAGIYLLKVNNRNTRARCEICSKLTIFFYFSISSVSIVNFEQVNAGWDIAYTVFYFSYFVLS